MNSVKLAEPPTVYYFFVKDQIIPPSITANVTINPKIDAKYKPLTVE